MATKTAAAAKKPAAKTVTPSRDRQQAISRTTTAAAKAVADHGPSNRLIAAFVAKETAAAKKAPKTKAAPTPAPAPVVAKVVAPATPALDAAAQAKPAPAKLATVVINDGPTPAVVCRRRGQSYTCIRLAIGEKHTHFITLASLSIQKAPNRDFHEEWEEYTDYPVRRAAELYLGTPHRDIEPQARRHLEAIVRDPATVYNLDATPTQPKETNMVTTAKKPATPAKTAPAAKPAAKATPAKAAAKTPAPAKAAAKPAAKQAAPAKTPAKQAVPAKPAAKHANGIATVVSGAKPPAKQAAAAAKPAATRAVNDEKIKVADASVARRGVTAEFQEEAVKLKTFTRQKLIDTMVAKGHDAQAARVKVADMVYFKILTPA